MGKPIFVFFLWLQNVIKIDETRKNFSIFSFNFIFVALLKAKMLAFSFMASSSCFRKV